MSCSKCCFYPCNCTAKCQEGTYWIRDVYGDVRLVIELSEPLKSVVSKAVVKAIEKES
jgi:hypothetical protein